MRQIRLRRVRRRLGLYAPPPPPPKPMDPASIRQRRRVFETLPDIPDCPTGWRTGPAGLRHLRGPEVGHDLVVPAHRAASRRRPARQAAAGAPLLRPALGGVARLTRPSRATTATSRGPPASSSARRRRNTSPVPGRRPWSSWRRPRRGPSCCCATPWSATSRASATTIAAAWSMTTRRLGRVFGDRMRVVTDAISRGQYATQLAWLLEAYPAGAPARPAVRALRRGRRRPAGPDVRLPGPAAARAAGRGAGSTAQPGQAGEGGRARAEHLELLRRYYRPEVERLCQLTPEIDLRALAQLPRPGLTRAQVRRRRAAARSRGSGAPAHGATSSIVWPSSRTVKAETQRAGAAVDLGDALRRQGPGGRACLAVLRALLLHHRQQDGRRLAGARVGRDAGLGPAVRPLTRGQVPATVATSSRSDQSSRTTTDGGCSAR